LTNSFTTDSAKYQSFVIDNNAHPPKVSIVVKQDSSFDQSIFFKGLTEKNSNFGKTSIKVVVCG
jgi:hypothetical protein